MKVWSPADDHVLCFYETLRIIEYQERGESRIQVQVDIMQNIVKSPVTDSETPEAGTTEDARIARSREALRNSLLGMLERQSLEHISIRDIAKEAGVGHATFYRHYATKEALLDDAAADEIRRLVDLSLPVGDAINSNAACHALCQYVYEHRTLWRTLLTGGAAGAMKEELLRISMELAADRPSPLNQLPKDLGVVLTVSSIVELLAWWLRQEQPLPVAEVADLLDQVVISPIVSN